MWTQFIFCFLKLLLPNICFNQKQMNFFLRIYYFIDKLYIIHSFEYVLQSTFYIFNWYIFKNLNSIRIKNYFKINYKVIAKLCIIYVIKYEKSKEKKFEKNPSIFLHVVAKIPMHWKWCHRHSPEAERLMIHLR